jgi:hypothetical protein
MLRKKVLIHFFQNRSNVLSHAPRGHNLDRTDVRVMPVNSGERILLEDDIHIEKGIKPKHNIRVTCIESGVF